MNLFVDDIREGPQNALLMSSIASTIKENATLLRSSLVNGKLFIVTFLFFHELHYRQGIPKMLTFLISLPPSGHTKDAHFSHQSTNRHHHLGIPTMPTRAC